MGAICPCGDVRLLFPGGGVKVADEPVRVFMCNQHTASSAEQIADWLALPEGAVRSMRASMPPFNRRDGTVLPIDLASINVPVFGPKINSAIMRLFEPSGLRALADEIGVRIPVYAVDSFLGTKLNTLEVLLAAARGRADCGGCTRTAVDQLGAFLAFFKKEVSKPSVSSPEEWRRRVSPYVEPGWEDRLHFDAVLSNFGFDEQSAAALRQQQHMLKDPTSGTRQPVTLEHFSVRWLSKALDAYKPVGCLADVANLVFALTDNHREADASEGRVAEVVARLADEVATFSAGGCFPPSVQWLPARLVHDGESDDTLSWLLLEFLHRRLDLQRTSRSQRQTLAVLVQLPTEPRLDDVAAKLGSRANCTVFRDPDSRNAKAVMKNFGL
eukprot:TRINITY_DN103719_c0_g1_i1.p1 TRINITY_DN103719_c0_g1~~TRINITY_DN103719_c0_g1_i1.p1  ORF type:complete len:385 (+),score=82.17 TRINITY_DN103719_c0_g1_i1:107-1261(+)